MLRVEAGEPGPEVRPLLKVNVSSELKRIAGREIQCTLTQTASPFSSLFQPRQLLRSKLHVMHTVFRKLCSTKLAELSLQN